ncbi:MAG: GntR family transcriptional regulator [Alphaproteobacteria bacterium]|nr:GntR family transcriptional regulator [Alphaproteobacteria bacterium]
MPARTSDQSLVDAATGVIRDRILDLSLPPAKAINTKDLAQQLKLSRTPVREALNRLAAEGLIRIEANHGVFVHPLDVDEINQLMEANRVAERLSAFYCDFDDPGLIAEVVDMQGRQRAMLKARRFLEASFWNVGFRTRIARSSKNHHFVDFHRRVLNHTRRLSYLIYTMEARDPSHYSSQLAMLRRLHDDIEKALRRADRDRLVAVLTEQADIIRERVANVIARSGGRDFPLGGSAASGTSRRRR